MAKTKEEMKKEIKEAEEEEKKTVSKKTAKASSAASSKVIKGKGGRPSKIDKIDKNQFEMLCGLQCGLKEMALMFGVHENTIVNFCRKTYKMNFKDTFDYYSGSGKVSLRRNLFNMSKSNTAAAIFLSKNILGYSDNPKDELDKDNNGNTYLGVPAKDIIPKFNEIIHDVINKSYKEYIFPGGRGSTKSAFISLIILDLIMSNKDYNAVILRQYATTLKTSVFEQMKWAISKLHLDKFFKITVSPLEITRIETGQKIYFRGADEPEKLKSIKTSGGYIAIGWFEELDQFHGEEACRTIEQSIIRGGDDAYIFKSFNPPKSKNNWANRYTEDRKIQNNGIAKVIESTYLDVPPEWLGKSFIEIAEDVKKKNPSAYENEYMGVANGNGGNVFNNIDVREMTDEEISHFDRIYRGVDWGYFPDLYSYTCSYYDIARDTLYIYDEYTSNYQSNKQTAEELIHNHHITSSDLITCDSAENKSVGDYKSYGLMAKSAIKGPGSIERSMRWLSNLKSIVIDNKRCPVSAKEFRDYEYLRDKDGEYITGYEDKNNHCIDSVRYATESIWKTKGE